MPMRDNFSSKVKLTVAIRAAHLCSNPACLRMTAGPHSDETKSLTTGHAGHMRAASPGGPRFDKNQPPAQRKAIANAVWLCRECGDLVDKDTSQHSAELLIGWKKNHEAMLVEVRTKGYADALLLLQAKAREPGVARKVIALFEDRRALWEPFDAEAPERVRLSLDRLREQLIALRDDVPDENPMNALLLSLTKTILGFFRAVEKSDLSTLRCNSGDPEWLDFQNALYSLRKSIRLQVKTISDAY